MRHRGKALCFSLGLAVASISWTAPPVLAVEGTRPVQEAPFAQGQRAVGVQGDQYGVLAATQPLTQRVEGIFAKLLRVSGKRPGAIFEVYVLDTPKILVQALPGGAVVISRGAVDLAGRDDNALAFLLAHEVAHVIRDHHGLLSSYQEVGGALPSPRAAPIKDEDGRALQAMELEADRLGLLYTSLAGYRARAAVPILQRVIAQTGSSPFHPDPRQRAESLQATIRQITAHLELFSLGFIYLASGRYEEAAWIYETLTSLYPSREVYNNLGVAYHKWALLYRKDDAWFRSIMIDPQTRARATLRDITDQAPGPGEDSHPLFRKYMDRALSAYRLAAESDPDYAIGHNNLGLAYLEAGEYDFAIGEFKRALRLDPKMKTAWNNRGIAYLKNGETGRARDDFLRAVALDPSYADPHGNLAKLYESTGRKDLAAGERKRFERLVPRHVEGNNPPTTEVIAGFKLGMEVGKASDPEKPGAVSLAVPLGLREEEALRVLVDERNGIVVASRQGQVEALGALTSHRGTTALGIGIGSLAARVARAYGVPARKEESPWAELWVYPERDLILVVADGRVHSWWLVSRVRDLGR